MNQQWLDLLASTGTALFVSPAEDSVGMQQRVALKEAFALVTSPQAVAEPVDFFHETTPEAWRTGEKAKKYHWCLEGASPFGA
jgi:alpha-galactosidase